MLHRQLGRPPTRGEVSSWVADMDSDGDGKVALEEFTALLSDTGLHPARSGVLYGLQDVGVLGDLAAFLADADRLPCNQALNLPMLEAQVGRAAWSQVSRRVRSPLRRQEGALEEKERRVTAAAGLEAQHQGRTLRSG